MNIIKTKFLLLAIIFFSVFFCHTANAADYTHFNTEKAKSGVIYSKAFRSTADAQQGYNSNDNIPFGSAGSAYYDSAMDATIIPLTYNVHRYGTGYGRNDASAFTPNSGPDIWIQWEQRVDQNFINDLSIPIAGGLSIYNTKLFRLGSSINRCGDDPILTSLYVEHYTSPEKKAWYMHENNACNFDGAQRIGDASVEGNKWLRFTWNINFNTKRVRLWKTDVSTGSTVSLVDFTDSNWNATYIDNAYPLIHLTTLDNAGWGSPPPHTTYIFAYRNVIVSTQSIAFTTGSAPPDTTPPAAPSGLSVR